MVNRSQLATNANNLYHIIKAQSHRSAMEVELIVNDLLTMHKKINKKLKHKKIQ